jgi:uncharacterized membrane protein required for colicin V production
MFIALHLYTSLSVWLKLCWPALNADSAGWVFLDFFFFLFVLFLVNFLFFILRVIFYRFIKLEAVPKLNKWGGFTFGLLRGICIGGVVLFCLAITQLSYFQNSIRHSLTGRYMVQVPSRTYEFLWDSVVSKFTPSRVNVAVLSIQEELKRK